MKALLGSRSVEKVLLFLLVNEEGYAHQMQRVLDLALTPVQKALERLEEGGVLKSMMRGRRKVYIFDESYPLAFEVEMLLKKAYQNLSLTEKKAYFYLPSRTGSDLFEANDLLRRMWNFMKNVKRLRLIVKSKTGREGKGEVTVVESGKSLIFIEKGTWDFDGTHFTNRYRWTWKNLEGAISLEHMRHGEEHSVLLFNFMPSGPDTLEPTQSYLCGQDAYFGLLSWESKKLNLQIRTIGPRKNETLHYLYQ